MSKSLLCFMTLLIVLFGEPSSGTESIPKYVCQGDDVQMFQNVTLTQDKPVNLYINGDQQKQIGTWYLNQTPSLLASHKDKVILDKNGTILIRNVQVSDEAHYVLVYGNDASNTKFVMQIHVMVALSKHCKPKTKKIGNLLIISLDEEDCGRPRASVQWLDNPDILIIDKDVVKIPPEREVDTYYACAVSPAVQCVINVNPTDYCIPFSRKGNNSPPVSPEITDIKTMNILTVIVIPIVAFVAVMAVKIQVPMLKCRRKNSVKSGRTDEEQLLLDIEHETEDATTDHQPNPNSQTSEEPQEDHPEHETQEAATYDEHNPNSETQTAPRKRLNAPICVICSRKTMMMYFLLCDHIARLYNTNSYIPMCANCINALPQCPDCRTVNRNKNNDDAFWMNI